MNRWFIFYRAPFPCSQIRARLHGDDDNELEVPTLHVFFARPHEQSAIYRTYPLNARNEELTTEKIRENLIKWIAAQSLGGDLEAAEWILLTIIARV